MKTATIAEEEDALRGSSDLRSALPQRLATETILRKARRPKDPSLLATKPV